MRAVVTGGTGFVGASLVRRLLTDGHDVHLLVRPQHRTWRLHGIASDVHLHVVELDDEAATVAVARAIRPEWVFHLAVYGAYSSQTDWREMLRTNTIGTANLVTAFLDAGASTIVNTGSSSEYGFKGHAPDEEEWLDPNSYYAVTKASATLFCRHTAKVRSVPVPTLRLYSAYGPYEEPTRLIPKLLVHAMGGGLPPLVDPTIARDYVYIDDVVDAYLAAVRRAHSDPGAVYNIGTGVQTTLAELVDTVRELLAVEVAPQWGSMATRSWDTPVWVAKPERAASELGWRSQTTLRSGLRSTIQWLQSCPASVAELYRGLRASS